MEALLLTIPCHQLKLFCSIFEQHHWQWVSMIIIEPTITDSRSESSLWDPNKSSSILSFREAVSVPYALPHPIKHEWTKSISIKRNNNSLLFYWSILKCGAAADINLVASAPDSGIHYWNTLWQYYVCMHGTLLRTDIHTQAVIFNFSMYWFDAKCLIFVARYLQDANKIIDE